MEGHKLYFHYNTLQLLFVGGICLREYPKLAGDKFKKPQQKQQQQIKKVCGAWEHGIGGNCWQLLWHAIVPRPPTVARPHLVNATLAAPKWPPAAGQCGQVGVVELFIIFCDPSPTSPLSLCSLIFFTFFTFVLYFLSFFTLLCFAAALFLARVPFCAYAILVYLLAILLAMNLFVFIVKPAAELPQNTNKQRPTSALAPPRPGTQRVQTRQD